MELEGVSARVCLSVERAAGVITFFKGPDTLEIFPLLGRPHHHNLYNNKTRLVYCFKFGN